jgi:hypothetical protein
VSRIVVLCEGETEVVAVRHFIARQWEADGLRSVGLDRIDLRAKLPEVGKFATRYLNDPKVLGVFTLVDLYKMNKVVHQPNDDLEQKVRRVRDWLRAQVRHPGASRFFPHVCVHETEAWILAEGRALAERLKDASIRPDPSAESKNLQNPPKKRVNELFQKSWLKRSYGEIQDGTPLFKRMEFDRVYECQYFREFYDDLKRAAAGVSS